MPKDAHITAAYHRERAAKSHRAAVQSNIGAHEACTQHAVTACDHSTAADEASRRAHEKSVERMKPVST